MEREKEDPAPFNSRREKELMKRQRRKELVTRKVVPLMIVTLTASVKSSFEMTNSERALTVTIPDPMTPEIRRRRRWWRWRRKEMKSEASTKKYEKQQPHIHSFQTLNKGKVRIGKNRVKRWFLQGFCDEGREEEQWEWRGWKYSKNWRMDKEEKKKKKKQKKKTNRWKKSKEKRKCEPSEERILEKEARTSGSSERSISSSSFSLLRTAMSVFAFILSSSSFFSLSEPIGVYLLLEKEITLSVPKGREKREKRRTATIEAKTWR